MVKGIDTILCPVIDMDRAVAFYRDGLGIPAQYVSSHWSSFDLGGVRMGLHPPFAAGAPTVGWVIGLAVDDLSAFRARLAEIGYPTDAEYHQTPNGVVLDFRDPDGNPLQATQRGIKVADLEAQ